MRGTNLQVSSVLTVAVLLGALDFAEQVKAPEGAKTVPPIPVGTILHVKLNPTLTSKTNQTGDTFTGVLAQPIVANGKEVVPKYSMLCGHVAFVKPSGRIEGVARMRVVRDKVVTPDEDLPELICGFAMVWAG